MEHARQLAFMDSILENLESPEVPDGITHTIDAKRYTSKERLEAERTKLLQNLPIMVGAASQLEKGGDYFLHDHTGVPIVVIKGKDGQIRAFVNMCRHRGVRLLSEETGHIKRNIICPYHAWSYDTEGCLKRLFHPKGFKGVSEESHSLVPLDCHTQFGLIFVVPNPDLFGSFMWEKYLAEVADVFETYGFETHVPFKPETRIAEANWKLLIDGGLEGYHFKVAHTHSIGPYFLDNAAINHWNTLHSSVVFPKKSIERADEKPRSEWALREHANILVNIFPNTVILIQPDHAMVLTEFPLETDRTLMQSFMLIPKAPASQKETDYWDLNKNIFWGAIEEDNDLAVMQQKTFNRFDDRPMTIGSFEKLILQFENLVDDVLEGRLKLEDFG